MAKIDDSYPGEVSAMEPKYSAHDIADYFLFKAQKDNQELLSNLKLQKLVYYAQGLHLALYGKPLFLENIEAWQYGPVIPDLYFKYRDYGSGGIPASEYFDPSIIDSDTKDFLDEIYDVFGQFSAIRLMDLAHEDQCWKDAGINGVITWDSMGRDLKKYLADE
jgi:uncharacterized phage-associated protein